MAITKLSNQNADWKKGADGKWTLNGATGTGAYTANWNGNAGQYYFKDGVMQSDATVDGVYYDKSGLGHPLGDTSDAYNKQMYSDYKDNLSSYLQYLKNAQEEARKTTELATKQGVDRLEAGRNDIYSTANAANTAASTNYELAQKRLPEQLAKIGITGQGAAETNQIGANNAYLANLNQIAGNRDNQLRTLDNSIVDLKNTGDLQATQLYADAAKEYAAAQLGVADRLYKTQGDQRDFAYQQGRDSTSDQQWKDQFDYGKAQDDVAYQQWLNQFNYTKERDAAGDQQWKDQFDYTKQRDLVGDQQWNKEHQLDIDKFAWQKSSSGSSSGGSNNSKPAQTTPNGDSLLNNATNPIQYKKNDPNKIDAIQIGDMVVSATEFNQYVNAGYIVPIDNGNGTVTYKWKASAK